MEMKIMSDLGDDALEGQEGEIALRGQMVMKSYWG
jgi:long-subunit acyl-CoA synthetase (AMP-forming)